MDLLSAAFPSPSSLGPKLPLGKSCFIFSEFQILGELELVSR